MTKKNILQDEGKPSGYEAGKFLEQSKKNYSDEIYKINIADRFKDWGHQDDQGNWIPLNFGDIERFNNAREKDPIVYYDKTALENIENRDEFEKNITLNDKESLIHMYELSYDVKVKERILNIYKNVRNKYSKPEKTDYGTYKGNLTSEEGYGMNRPFYSETKCLQVNNLPCGFSIDVGKLLWESGNKWIEINSTPSAVINVGYDHDSNRVSDYGKCTYGRHGYAPYLEAALRLAKQRCQANGYELEKVILDIPNVRRLIKESGTKGFFFGSNKDLSSTQGRFDAIELVTDVAL